MKKILLLLLITTFSFAQNADRKFISGYWSVSDDFPFAVFVTEVSDGEYYFRFYNEFIVEISFVPLGEKINTISHAVVLKDKNVEKLFLEDDKNIWLKTENIAVEIQKTPFKVSYYQKDKLILSEKAGYIKRKHIPLDYVSGNIKADSTEVLQFNISSDEILYGGGARALGMNRRSHKLPLFNRAHYGYETHSSLMNFSIPLVISSKMYAVHFDNPAIGYLDLDSQKDNTLEYEAVSGRKTYQIIVGDNWKDLVSNYTDLTGKQPLIPQWSLGNFASRFGYRTQEETEATIRKFEENNIPVDAIILDLYWFGKTIKGTMGNLDWDRETFPEPEKMIADFNKKGIKTILITEPFILTTSSKWKEATDKKVLATFSDGKPATWDFYFGNTGIIDIFKPEGKDWFWNVYKRLANQGVGGIWGDLGEPEVFPSEVITTGGTASEVHNIYGHNWVKLVYEGYQKDFPNERPFILMRAGYSGSQHYGMIPWSGDVNRTWGGLQSQTEISLQMGMQGLGYMHSDLGGFAGDYYDNELYLRWLQYGVFQPIFRPHAQESVASEVARKDIATMQKAKKTVELRYQLLPYNYTLAFKNSTTGMPLMRPLFFEEPENKNLQTLSDTYLWGDDFLIKPITQPSVTSTEVYFPKTANWFDFYTDKKYNGGTTQTVVVTETEIPTFVRGGSFVPMIKTIQNTTQYSLENFDLHFYFDETITASEGKIYNDNGTTPDAYQKGEYEILHFGSNLKNKVLTVKLSSEIGENYTETDKKLVLHLHNLQPKKVFVDGKLISETNKIPLKWQKSTTREIRIEF
ncbi:MAG TPA: TIM-barrel domain-containing protein [Flavobacterium sp.]|nr:TIM-barrel domain-containing protein [Flavobacterium sp.]